MAARLVSEEGDLKGLVLPLENEERWIIGRDPDECQLVIHDPLVSRQHATAYMGPEGIYIQNLSETNPIQINDEEIGDEPYLLRQGDTVKFGNELFRYYVDADAHILDEEFPSGIEQFFEEEENEPEPSSPETEPAAAHAESSMPPEEPIKKEEPPIPHEKSELTLDKTFDTVLNEDEDEFAPLAEIDFGLTETGRWLIKVVSGPNNGAEFYMQTGSSYFIGTDPNTCDIVFHDTSVSRQHAKISISPDDELTIQDMKSRNGVLISGSQITDQEFLLPGNIVTLGTTSFIVYDREGDMQTIISPLLPAILKVLQGAEKPAEEPVHAKEAYVPAVPEPVIPEEPVPTPPPPKPQTSHLGGYILVAMIIGLLLVVGIGTTALFRSEPVKSTVNENADELIQNAIAPYQPAVKYAYNKATGGLLLIGHVSTAAEKNQLLYSLHNLPFIKTVDDSGLVVDEGVWREINSILARNAAWKGISINSPAAGKFVLSGTLQTRKQAEQLSDYIGINFPYLDLLERRVVVEEEVVNQIRGWLLNTGLSDVDAKMANGEVTLTGSASTDQANQIPGLIEKIKSIPGVRVVSNFIEVKSAEMGIVNLSSQYQITGSTKVRDKYTVVINGKILSEGDYLDNMLITSITPNAVFLEKDSVKYRIDYK